MANDQHHRKLENFFHTAKINEFYTPEIKVSDRKTEISIQIEPKFFHAGHSVHGSVYFKLLDDACYFACQSVELSHFLVTSSFNIHYMAPVTEGTLRAVAEIESTARNVSFARGEVYDSKNRLVATGHGTFMRSRLTLNEDVGYQ
jgi:uncharacterized protein (TIGR00369 family)